MSARSSSAATGVLVVFFVTAGCDATPQQQSDTLSNPANQAFILVTGTVQKELRPIVRRLESRIESLDSRLTLLDSREGDLTATVLRGGQSQQMDELSSRLGSLETRLNEVIAQMNEHKSEQDKVTATLASYGAQLLIIAARLENPETKLTQLSKRVDNQQSQLSDLSIQLSGQRSHQDDVTVAMDNHTARLDNHTAQLDSLASQVESQGSQLAELTSFHQSQRTELMPTKDRAVNQTSTPQAVADQIDDTANHPHDCSDLDAGSASGIYSILPSSDYRPIRAYCDMDSTGETWTVIQRRDDIQPRQDFYLGWAEYRQGFGNLTGEFWWGLENIHQLTASNHTQYELRVELETFDGDKAYAVYHGFGVSSEDDGYRLRASYVTGSAEDGLRLSVNQEFSTHDRDQDEWPGNCADFCQGGWWYRACGYSNMNGRYKDNSTWSWDGIWWKTWSYESLKRADMKIRPRQS